MHGLAFFYFECCKIIVLLLTLNSERVKFDKMKNPELFHKTIGILVNAYLNDTLRHVNCYACAVGNIVAANMGYKYHQSEDFEVVEEQAIVWDIAKSYGDTSIETWFGAVVFNRDITETVLTQIKSTGYTIRQLANIEESFEGVDIGCNEDRHRFNGLMAVCDVLMKIHGANESEIKEAKSLFVKELTD